MNVIHSMTGYGRYENKNEERMILVEIKSVNQRYLDIGLKMPRKLSQFDSPLRKIFKKYMSRGKVDVFVSYAEYTKRDVAICYHSHIAAEYLKYFEEMSREFHIDNNVNVTFLSKCPDVFTLEEESTDESGLWEMVKAAAEGAAEQFVESRSKEGLELQRDLLSKLDGMLEKADAIEKLYPQVVQEYKTKLEGKIREVMNGVTIDESRILTEVTVFSEKICVDEELVRLRSHIHNVKDTLTEGGYVGRKLDFIVQEMNREINTILSKSNDIVISNIAIDLKTEIEKIREQIQNIE